MVQESAQTTVSAANITYDKLFEILRYEKTEAALQSIPETFFADVIQYLKTKQDAIVKLKSQTDMVSEGQLEVINQQIRNAKKIILEIYNRREKKIVSLALNKSRTQSNMIDTSGLLNEERELFNHVSDVLQKYRDTIANNCLDIKPVQRIPEPKAIEQTRTDDNYVFMDDVPEFYGPDMKQYGPFAKNDTAALPAGVAKLLLSKNQIKAA